MKRLVAVACVILVFGAAAFARGDELQKSADVLNEIMSTPDRGIPHDLLDRAVCVGIVPSEIKGAFLVGGTYGRGYLTCRERGNGAWGPPSEFRLGEGSFGFQIGGESTDVVFLVMNESGARKLVQDSVKLGADVSIAAGPVGRTASGATDAQLHAEILSYSRSRGAFAGVSLSGAVFKQDKAGNRDLYGHALTGREILTGEGVTIPSEAMRLDRDLARYSNRGGAAFAGL